MVVEQERGPVEPDRRLPRPRSPLHGHELVERGPDDLVLFRLNGGDDVEHLAGAGPFQLGQQCVPTPEPGAGRVAVGPEEVIGHGHHRAPVDHDLPAPGESPGVGPPGLVEGDRHRGPPVDDDRIAASILDVTPADVPGGPGLLVDPTEEQGARAVGQQLHPAHQSGLVVEVRTAGAPQVVEQRTGPSLHRRQGQVGLIEVLLFGADLRVLTGRCGPHRPPRPRSRPAGGSCWSRAPAVGPGSPAARLTHEYEMRSDAQKALNIFREHISPFLAFATLPPAKTLLHLDFVITLSKGSYRLSL